MDSKLKISALPKRRTIRCPNCGSTNTAKILYGMLNNDDELQQKLDTDKVVLGGCCVSFDEPIRHCNECTFDY